MSIETNLKKSFSEVRKDILEIKDQILRLAEQQEKLESAITESKKKPVKKKKAKK